jgi:glutamate racemase
MTIDHSSLNDRPIGVFDSGIGGLTVAAALHRRLPAENLIYLGDTARVPYGTKSAAAVNRYALESALFLLNRGVKLIVVACNTVSAVALPRLRELLSVPMIGVVEPGVIAALKISGSRRIGVIGTPSTIASRAYQDRLLDAAPGSQVWGRPCPLLVPLAEEGRLEGKLVHMVLQEYLKPLKQHQVDSLILGCTHYPLFKNAIQDVMGEQVVLIDSAETTSEQVEAVLLREGLLRTHGPGGIKAFVTDVPRQFDRVAKRFFGAPLGRVQRVVLGDGH